MISVEKHNNIVGIFDSRLQSQDEIFVVDDLQDALAADCYSTSHPLHHPEGRFTGDITYSKVSQTILICFSIF